MSYENQCGPRSVGAYPAADSTSMPVAERSPVCAALDDLRCAQDHTHDLLGRLERRLEAVLRVVPESAAPKGSRTPDCMLAEELDHRLSTAVAMNARLVTLLDRLAL